jgi:hypothetical protein
MGLKQIEREYFKFGKEMHRVVQDHLSYKKPLNVDTLRGLGKWEVEECEKDPNMEVEFKIDRYTFNGYVDAKQVENKQFLDIKSGASWSPLKMYKSHQFSLYSYGLGFSKFKLIHVPKVGVKYATVHNCTYTREHHDRSLEWVRDGIKIIQNIKEEVKKEDFNKTKWSCHYEKCPYH